MAIALTITQKFYWRNIITWYLCLASRHQCLYPLPLIWELNIFFLFFYGVIRTVAQTPVADCERENLIGTKGGPVTITLSFFITENYDLKIIWKN